MANERPRRALRPPLAVRIARIAVPAAVVGVIFTGVIVAASPGQTQIAYPAPAANFASAYSSSSATVASRHQAGSRGLTSARPSVSPTSAATAAAAPTPAQSNPAQSTPAQSTPAQSTTAESRTAQSSPTPSASAKPSKPALSLEVTGKKYATADLNVRTKPKQDADVVSEVKAGARVSITKTVRDGYRYVSYEGKGRWVTDKYLADKKPSALGGISNAPCATGSAMESGLTSDAILVHRTLCARYPQVTSFGGTRGGGGNHGSGRAVDCMISNTAVGLQMADWVRAHAKQLGVSEVIYRQRIWTVQRGSEGWRGMSDRGSATANHYDHVHVSVYGNRASG